MSEPGKKNLFEEPSENEGLQQPLIDTDNDPLIDSGSENQQRTGVKSILKNTSQTRNTGKADLTNARN